MTTETKRAAEASLSQLEEVTSVVLPEPQGDVVALEEAPAPLADGIRKRMAEIDLRDGGVCLVQAGHPHPFLLAKDGEITLLGDGGLPIGLVQGAGFQQVNFRLLAGDRLFLVSDGVTECPSPQGEELGSEGLIDILRNNLNLESAQLLEALIWDLNSFAGGLDFPDDVSGLIFDYHGVG